MLSPLLVLFLCVSSHAYQVPACIEKISHNLIRNGTTYYAVYFHYYSLLLTLDYSNDPSIWPHPWIPILSKENKPRWTTGEPFQSADINVIGEDQVRIYFSANTGKKYALGVAFSDHIVDRIQNEYLTLNMPLVEDTSGKYDYFDPSLILTSDTLLLTFIEVVSQLSMMNSVRLSSDGLTKKGAPVRILKPDLHWEGNQIKNHWGFERNGYIYIVYETEGGVGVARSRSDAPLGLFEKMTEPLIVRGKEVPARHKLQEALQWQTNGWPSVDL